MVSVRWGSVAIGALAQSLLEIAVEIGVLIGDRAVTSVRRVVIVQAVIVLIRPVQAVIALVQIVRLAIVLLGRTKVHVVTAMRRVAMVHVEMHLVVTRRVVKYHVAKFAGRVVTSARARVVVVVIAIARVVMIKAVRPVRGLMRADVARTRSVQALRSRIARKAEITTGTESRGLAAPFFVAGLMFGRWSAFRRWTVPPRWTTLVPNRRA